MCTGTSYNMTDEAQMLFQTFQDYHKHHTKLFRNVLLALRMTPICLLFCVYQNSVCLFPILHLIVLA
jgi:hypothetical protein